MRIWIVVLAFIGLTLSCQESGKGPIQKTKSISTKKSGANRVEKTKHNDTPSLKPSHIQQKVERFTYPQMSLCGGSLHGLYSNDELIRIESTYGYDMGFSEKNIDFKKGRITKIEYREHFADWERYNQHFGNEVRDFDPRKMTYVDTLYILQFEPVHQFNIYSGKKRVQRQVSKELIDRLLECAATMQEELSNERAKR